MCESEIEQYYLISESDIKNINSKITVLNKAAQFMGNEGFKTMSESLIAYGTNVGKIINHAKKCDVVPRSIFIKT